MLGAYYYDAGKLAEAEPLYLAALGMWSVGLVAEEKV